MKLISVKPFKDYLLEIQFDDKKYGLFDVSPYLSLEAFQPLKRESEFKQVHNGGYFIEWPCGADLSADTIEAHLIGFSSQKNDSFVKMK